MSRQYTNETMLAALNEMKGMVYLAAKRVGCSSETIYARARISPEIRDCIRQHRGEVVDTAELKLYNGILNSEPWAIQMALKCLGKDRGYVDRTEHTGPDGTPLPTPIIRLTPSPERVTLNGDTDCH